MHTKHVTCFMCILKITAWNQDEKSFFSVQTEYFQYSTPCEPCLKNVTSTVDHWQSVSDIHSAMILS